MKKQNSVFSTKAPQTLIVKSVKFTPNKKLEVMGNEIPPTENIAPFQVQGNGS